MSHWMSHKACWYPGRMRVAGKWLRPLTLGHLRLLEIIESPFLAGGSVGIEDVAVAVAIVSHPFWLARWSVGRRWALRLLALPVAVYTRDWKKESGTLNKYLSDNLWMPEQYRKENEIQINPFGYSSSLSMRLAWMVSGKWAHGVPIKSHPVWNLTVMEVLAWRLTDTEINGREFVTRDEVEMTEKAITEAVSAEAEQNELQGGA